MTAGASQIGTRSVLFTDLVGSTELRVRLGEDGADELRRNHDALVTDAVTGHGGTVVKGLGDGLMVTFDSAADALAGAIAAQQGIEAHGRRHPEQAFAIRVGISTGDVASEGGDVFGVPVVEAARLCAAAGGGEILAADLVRALARGRGDFTFEPMGELELKGLAQPLPAGRVVWEPLVVSSQLGSGDAVPVPAPLLGAATPYVGRANLRDRLDLEWQAARDGETRVILLAGEPGVGKTRTAAEAARAAFGAGALVLYGRCDESLAVPYQPFVEALGHYVRHAARPVLGRLPGELTRLTPDLGGYVGDLPPAIASDPASEEYRLREATASWLCDAAQVASGGVVLVLDDIHWATKPTLQLMQHVVRSASDERTSLLVLATYRDTDIDRAHPLAGVLGDLRRLPGVDRLTVDNLSSSEVMAFLESAAGHELGGELKRLAEAIYEETEGNPFFVGEVLRHLIETGGVRREGDRWVVGGSGHVAVPEGVRDVVGRRLNRLSSTANDVLSVAAVVGRDFDVALLLEVVDVPENAVLDSLDVAVRARLVEEVGVDRYHFGHALVRATLYEELSATRRRRLHGRVADALEKLRPDDVRALAHHCVEGGLDGPDGGEDSRAVRYTLAAAELSLTARAFAEAEMGFRAALELLETAGPGSVNAIAARCGLGEALRDQGDHEFRQTLLDASQQAWDAGEVTLMVRAVLANTRGVASIIGGIDEERVHYLTAALELVGPQPSPSRARVLGMLASELTFSGHHERRLHLADEAETMARSLGDPSLLGEVLVTTAYACMSGERWQRVVPRHREAVELADASGDPSRRVLARTFLGATLLTAGDVEESVAATREARAIAEAEGSPFVKWLAAANSIRLLALAGKLDEADELNNGALAQARALGESDGDSWWASTTMGLMSLRGTAGSLADAAGAVAEQYPLAPIWRCAHAWLLAEAGRLDEARVVAADPELDPVDLIVEPLMFVGVFQLSFVAWELQDSVLADRVVVALRPYRGAWAHYFMLALGPVSWAIGLALAAAGAYDDAVTELEAALDDVNRRGAVAYAPKLEMHLAEVLCRRAAAGDTDRAHRLLATAREYALSAGAGGLVERMDATLSGVSRGRGTV
jgi:class 3 adenylate cyclase/tetratricopeptide (TPR) repeat protein